MLLSEPRDRLLLGFEQVFDTRVGDLSHALHLRARKRLALSCTLNFDKLSRTGHDKVHIDLGSAVFLIAKVEEYFRLDDTDAHGCHRVLDWGLRKLAFIEPALYRFHSRHVGASNRRGACAAIGLNDVAVDPNGPLAK